MTDKLYAKRDIEGQDQYYLDHIMAMTSENLHFKSDIAAELAHRDIEIADLKEEIEQLKNGEGEFTMEAFRRFQPSAE